MKVLSPFMQSFENLPNTLAIFPLNNAVVLPGSNLPLNIFEPRYLNMIQDALSSHRLIGMIQPKDNSPTPTLYKTGCAARISRYEEMNDGRIEISLTGLCRFKIQDELTSTRGYRLIVPDWSNYKIDYENDDSLEENLSFTSALKHYFNQTDFKLDWRVMEKLNPTDLFNALYYFIDLSAEDKQMLLEMDSSQQRIKALTAILNSREDDNLSQH